MNRVLAAVLLAVVVAVALLFGRDWWGGGRLDGVPAEDGPSAGPTTALERLSTPVQPPSSDTPTPDIEAVARDGEVLPPIRIGERGRSARFRPEVFRGGMQLSGEVLLRGLTEPREVWVRWDSSGTRERFLGSSFRVPGMHVLESGEAVVLVEPLVPMLRFEGFGARLDGSVLRIGAEGAYPPDPPAKGETDGSGAESPANPPGGSEPRPPDAPQRPGESSPR